MSYTTPIILGLPKKFCKLLKCYNNIYSHTQNRNKTLSNDQYQEVLNSLDSEKGLCVFSPIVFVTHVQMLVWLNLVEIVLSVQNIENKSKQVLSVYKQLWVMKWRGCEVVGMTPLYVAYYGYTPTDDT